jgi:hypothetical protein
MPDPKTGRPVTVWTADEVPSVPTSAAAAATNKPATAELEIPTGAKPTAPPAKSDTGTKADATETPSAASTAKPSVSSPGSAAKPSARPPTAPPPTTRQPVSTSRAAAKCSGPRSSLKPHTTAASKSGGKKTSITTASKKAKVPDKGSLSEKEKEHPWKTATANLIAAQAALAEIERTDPPDMLTEISATAWPETNDAEGWTQRALALSIEVRELSMQLRLAHAALTAQKTGDPDQQQMRAEVLRAFAKLLPDAIARARSPKGSPALLRLIVRSLKSL